MKLRAGLVALIAVVAAPGAAEAAALPPQAEALVSRALGADDPRYRVGSGRTAANTAHRLTARFGTAGARVRAGASSTAIELVGVGRGRALRAAGTPTSHVTENEVSYRRPGLREWYVNGPSGLEHGFTMLRRPGGGSEAVTLALELSGALVARVDGDRRGVTFHDPRGGERLVYRGLWAADARGRDLKAWLELRGRQLRIRVDDSGARYPLTIDPFFQAAKLTATDAAANDRLGSSVAISGDTLVAGAPDDDGTGADQGSVYVFVKPASGWANATQTAKLTASDGAMGHSLGRSVAIDGDTIVAGAPGANKAYVFVKPPGGWASGTQNARLTVPGLASFADLGISVDVEGDVVAVGAQYSNAGGATNEGAAYVFEKGAAAWSDKTQTGALVNFYGEADDRLGYSVAVGASGATIVAGAPADDVGTAPVKFDQGSVVVFNRPAATWGILNGGIEYHEATLLAPDGVADDSLGYGVAMEGDTIVGGALFADVAGRVSQGAVYVWQGAVLTWIPKTKLVASDGVSGDRLGWRVAISGNSIVAGAIGDDSFRGSAYVFRNPGSGWENAVQIAKLTGADGAAGDSYSEGVAVSGATVAVGSIGTASGQGAAYVHVEDALAPVAPVLLNGSPSSPSNVNARVISGSAEPGSHVRLYGAAGCTGPVLAEGSAAQLAAGLALTVGDNTTTALYATATDIAGNLSACSPTALTVVEDSAPPAAPAISGPRQVTAGGTAQFAASSDDGAGSGVAPSAFGWTGPGLPARSGNTAAYTFAAPGTYTLRVIATDRAGNASPASTFAVTVEAVTLATRVSFTARFFRTYTRIASLSARGGVPAGATIRVTCSGRGCPFQTRTIRQRRTVATVSLTRLFNPRVRRRTVPAKLRPNAKIEVRITAPAMIGRFRSLTIRSSKRPTSQQGCLAVGTSRRIRC